VTYRPCATPLYRKTKDQYYFKDFLSHEELGGMKIYINIKHTIFEMNNDEFIVKVTEKAEEIKNTV
jgi:hypothetical protein